ncbi:site-specific integrase [Bosea sp. (in: a-proteobacteria)]|uniref:site-specific integrase n=1 Tax=Bosea sp. (in: a-proteobacteria) TaxID=1871050 RepID=UPI0027334F77|nr:site-specific integrase [Bosea sp. (in: a-proteobacteria)]MDP3411044.1 site-specific integrase [Bosea sp. (in: a-proteobacteria)]
MTSTALLSAETETRRALQLDALAGILPLERRDKLAQILTDDDVETLRHLAREGMGENSLRALASDLAYLEAWAIAATGSPLPWPAPEALALKFVAHHLWDPARRTEDAAHGMPAEVEASLRAGDHLRSDGPHASSTVKRRLAHWATLHRWKGLESPLGTPAIRTSMRLAVRASAKPRRRKSKRAVTREILDRLIATCQTDRLADSRDLAILLVAFASGGRRRSEVARLRLEQLTLETDVPLDPDDPNSPRLLCMAISLGRTKTTQSDDDARVLLIGPPVAALREWIERADIKTGAVFRAIDRWEAIDDRALTPQAINLVLKRRCAQAGLDPAEFSAHGLRSGYLTEAARNGVPLPAAMRQSQHRSVQQASRYYNDADQALGKATRLAI